MNPFLELSIIIVIATVISGLMRMLKQPLIMGHIITGLIVGPQVLKIFTHTETIDTFAQFGISILLFIVGLSLSPKVVREVGKVSLIAGVSQVLFTTITGFFISRAFHFSVVQSLYLAIALTFSSTTIILKLLSDKKDLEKLYSRISVGIILVQDVIAIFVLIFVSAFSKHANVLSLALLTAARGLVLTLILILISQYLLPKLSAFFAASQEYLFLFAIGWGFGMAAVFNYLGFSIEIGALIAGVTLSISPYAREISSKLKPLRDFFLIMFFISLGSNMVITHVKQFILPAIIFSLYVLIGNPIIVMIILGILGYNKKVGFLTGLTMAQVGEFSLIILVLGVKVGHLNQEILSLGTVVALITIATSTYLILYSEKIYPHLSRYLVMLERKRPVKEQDILGSYDVILFGCNRVGYDFIRLFKHLGQSFLAIDFDPQVVKDLLSKRINARYGDAEDAEFLDELAPEKSKMVVSTIPDFESNSFLLSRVRKHSQEVIVILISYNIDEALKLYEEGATYVIMPHFIGGQVASEIAHKSGLDINNLIDKRDEHIDYLKERKTLGHLHPVWR